MKRTKEQMLAILRANHIRTILSTHKQVEKPKRYYLCLDKKILEIIEL